MVLLTACLFFLSFPFSALRFLPFLPFCCLLALPFRHCPSGIFLCINFLCRFHISDFALVFRMFVMTHNVSHVIWSLRIVLYRHAFSPSRLRCLHTKRQQHLRKHQKETPAESRFFGFSKFAPLAPGASGSRSGCKVLLPRKF